MCPKSKIGKCIAGIFIPVLSIVCTTASGQAEKKLIRQGNGLYNDNKYSEAEVSYRKAIDKNKLSTDAAFNLGDALYKQNKFEEAGKEFLDNSAALNDRIKKSTSLYNLGNSLLNNKKIKESIEAYKGSLKLNPRDEKAKYNLAYAQDLLKLQQQQQQKNQDNKENNKDGNKDNQKTDQNKDQNKSQENKQEQNRDNKQQQQQEQKISKEDAQRLLNALANDEKNVQEKVKLAKAAKEKVRTRINW